MASSLKRCFKGILIALLVLLLAAAALVYYVGAWHILFPSSQHDVKAPTLPVALESPAILLFSKTNQFRHKEGIVAGRARLAQIAQERGWAVFSTENGAVFNPDDLQRFAAVVFLNATGDMLSTEQQLAFQRWLEQGGGWLGIHAAGDGSHKAWPWYMENLIGAKFTAHIMGPQFQTARVLVEDEQHPLMLGLPSEWEHEEEWYSWESSPRVNGFHVLATVDEDSYSPVVKLFNKERSLRMDDHPVIWSNCVGKGRSIYSALGHSAESFDQSEHRKLLENALAWTLGLSDSHCPSLLN
ncbi:ThuA domain-containing protein [Parahaliea sp. F7430]|uniref:ThuA domain-containing protein n=1 Tax=Sediminihaliea albiluteola TaxID=2758564 RepID=A0A7W2TTY4_9GAMM|nr:ThuA domain-containing protein [Sediminihaliea albiluteola]MBA6411901.1 ThuA domain-containing protein [Sediminihaliea albiluteola]